LILICDGSYYLLLLISFIFWFITKAFRFFLKDDAHLFLERYCQMKKQYLKNPESPNKY